MFPVCSRIILPSLSQRPLDHLLVLRPLCHDVAQEPRAERDVAALASDDFSPVFLRNATAYGSSPKLRTDLVVNDLTAHALLTGEVRLLSDGAIDGSLVSDDPSGDATLLANSVAWTYLHMRQAHRWPQTG